jgi:hypothetical protein
MKRIITVLAAAALTAAMLVAGALPVFAQGRSETAPNCEHGNDTAYFSPGVGSRNEQATYSLDKNYFGPESGKERGAYCLQP